MSLTVCLSPTGTLDYPEGGGHLWVYLNWALGLQAAGCRVIWMEVVSSGLKGPELQTKLATLKARLHAFGVKDVALYPTVDVSLPREVTLGCLDLRAAMDADLLLNLRYDLPAKVVAGFRRTALLDLDPGLLQVWMSAGSIQVSPHDIYFTIGESVGSPDALFPDCGLTWHYTPPTIHLPEWPASATDAKAAFTTVSNWWGEWLAVDGEVFPNDKRTEFLRFLNVPLHTSVPLELALCFGKGEHFGERELLEENGWAIRDAWTVTSTPQQYREYIQQSKGEFSCAKPAYIRLKTAWLSDRSLCYLASGKPVVVQHTGQSKILPDMEGLFRFHTVKEAAQALATASSAYDYHCRRARALCEEYFSTEKVIPKLLEKALA